MALSGICIHSKKNVTLSIEDIISCGALAYSLGRTAASPGLDKVPARRLGRLGRAWLLLARLDSPVQRKPQRPCPCPRRASPGHEDENMSCQGGNPIAVWMNILAGRKQDDGAVKEVR